jgi:hypothetical protein
MDLDGTSGKVYGPTVKFTLKQADATEESRTEHPGHADHKQKKRGRNIPPVESQAGDGKSDKAAGE